MGHLGERGQKEKASVFNAESGQASGQRAESAGWTGMMYRVCSIEPAWVST